MEHPSEPLRPTTLVLAAVVFYGLMAMAGVMVLVFSDLDASLVIFGPSAAQVAQGHAPMPFDHALAALLGAGSGLAVVGLSHLMRRIGPLDRIQKEFSNVLGRQTLTTIAVLAVTSAIGEELLFRGALQPLMGFWPTTILFGLLHGGGTPRLFAWTIFAFLSGLLLGGLAIWTGSLLAPILCHLTVNFWNLLGLDDEPDARR